MRDPVALLDERTACTFDTYQTKIDCVDRSGRVIGHFGSAGEGPGEFRDPTQLVRGTDGSLGVMDNISSKFLVFTRVGELITEFSLPNRRVFYPASPFDTTIIGVSWGTGPVADGIDDILVGVEILLATGELVRTWRPPGRPEVPACDRPNERPTVGFPGIGGSGDQTWVFRACHGHMAFVEPDGETTVIQAPTYVAELPGARDVEELRNMLVDLRRRNGLSTDPSSDVLRRFAERPKLYHLDHGQPIFDYRGRLWISTRRDRNESSFIDVYAGTEFVATIKVRDRMIDFDVFDGTLAVLVERQAGPDDADGVPDRGIDWYDLGGF